MADKKITKRENFMEMVAMFEKMNRTDLADVIRHEIELMDKKNANKSPSKATLEKRAENSRLADVIFGYLNKDKAKGIADLKVEIAEIADFSSSKISAIVKPLVDSGKVERVYEKKVAKYRLV